MATPHVLINVQFLRFVASLLVIVFHASAHYRNATGRADWLAPVQYVGFAGVDIFFVISGFVMWYSNRDDHSTQGALRFLYHRLARIYIGYWPFLALMLLDLWILRPDDVGDYRWVESVLLLPQKGLRPIQVSWTLTFELYFYLLFSLLLFFKRRLRILTIVSVAVLIAYLYQLYYTGAYGVFGHEDFPWSLRFVTAPWLLQFISGCFVAVACERQQRFGAVALVSGVLLFVAGGVLNATVFEGLLDRFFYTHWRVLIFGGASVLLIYALVALEKAGITILGRFSILAGGASYCAYLSHPVFLSMADGSGLTRWLAREHWLGSSSVILFSAFVVVFSMLYYRSIERTLYHRVKQLW